MEALYTFALALIPALIAYLASRARNRSDAAEIITRAAAQAVKLTEELLEDANQTIEKLKTDYGKLQEDYSELKCLYHQQVDVNRDLRERDAQRELELAKLKEQYESQIFVNHELSKRNKANERELSQLRQKIFDIERKTGPLSDREKGRQAVSQ
jgi:chromosome segregation ATPase